MERIVSNLPPVYFGDSETLILGAFPSPISRAAAYYYANPQNRFWRVLAAAYDCSVPTTESERTALLRENRLALWDVLSSCTIRGASDASIRDPVTNDVPSLLRRVKITRIFCTGQTAARLYERYLLPQTGVPAQTLPSPSAANAQCSLAALTRRYRALLRADPSSRGADA